MQTIILAIEGMHCEGCVQIVQQRLEEDPGIKGTTISLAPKQARVAYDPTQTSAEAIVGAVSDAGYTATPVEE